MNISNSYRILLVHPNFPGQFKYICQALIAEGYLVDALCHHADFVPNVRVHNYQLTRGSSKEIHPWLIDFETKIIRAQAAYKMALDLRDAGYVPDVIWAHHAWGDSLFLKQVWPNAKVLLYCEFYYQSVGADIDFDPEFPSLDSETPCKLTIKNLINDLHFNFADGAIAPTLWQKSVFPEHFHEKISVIHEGVDTDLISSNPDVVINLNKSTGQQLHLTKDDDVITFVNRNLEPYRGYHIFMRALPEIQRQKPDAHIVIIGESKVGYGPASPSGQSWRDIFLSEVGSSLDLSKIHFLGHVQYQDYLKVLQISAVHIYLTYPFVLSWSLIEAMSAGCAIVASDTPPLREVIQHNGNGKLVNFFDVNALSREVINLLNNRLERIQLGAEARKFAVQNYDLRSVCLPKQVDWVNKFLNK